MAIDKTLVYEWIEDNEPVEQDKLEKEFGNRGLKALRKLLIKDNVSYTLDYKLQTED